MDTVLGESSKKVLEKLNNGGDDPLGLFANIRISLCLCDPVCCRGNKSWGGIILHFNMNRRSLYSSKFPAVKVALEGILLLMKQDEILVILLWYCEISIVRVSITSHNIA